MVKRRYHREVGRHSSPICVVIKKSEEARCCLDFRVINKVLEKRLYGLPTITELVTSPNAFNCKEVDKASREIFGFQHSGSYHFKRLPFGVVLASFCFQFAIDKLLNEVIGTKEINSESGKTFICTQAYIDDIVIASDTFEGCVQGTKDVMKLFEKHKVTINAEKTKWFVQEAIYLGYHLKNGQVGLNGDKVKAIKRIEAPKNVKEVKSFLASEGYFIHILNTDLSELEAPLIELLKKGVKYICTEDCQKSFEKIKEFLTAKPVVKSLDENERRPLILLSDASSTGIGACLAILKDEILNPVAYFSRVLKAAEKNYSAYLRELVVDNKSLSFMLNAKYEILDDQMLRHHLKLAKYNF